MWSGPWVVVFPTRGVGRWTNTATDVVSNIAGAVREAATLDEEESRRRAARKARFTAAPKDQAADACTAVKRHAWPGGTMAVVMPGKQPRAVVAQGSVRMMEVDGNDESEVTMTTPAEPAAASAGATAKAPLRELPTRAA